MAGCPVHFEHLIGATMGSVHVQSPADKGDYHSVKNAALALAEFGGRLHLEICRHHNARHETLG